MKLVDIKPLCLVFVATIALATPFSRANAQCTNPDGTEGQIFYNATHKVVQFCNGAAWVNTGAFANTGLPTTCDPGDTLSWDGTIWTCASDAGGGGSEPTTACAGPPDCPDVGNTCTDGTVFAGCAPPSYQPVFVTRCDLGQSWNGTTCTGTRTRSCWNDCNDTGYTQTPMSDTDGKANTEALQTGGAYQDSNGDEPGIQPHRAANHCANLTANTHSDWYLPSQAESYLLRINHALIPGLSGTYWTSSIYPTGTNYSYAWQIQIPIGLPFLSAGRKHYGEGSPNTNYIRCMRR